MGRPREVIDEEIVVAVRRCFFERGAGVSAVDVAHEVGVSQTTLWDGIGGAKR